MTAVRPDDTEGTGERSWFHEYGFEGGFDFDAVLEFATAHGFTFVYGGTTRDDVWVGYPAECDRLVAAVREAEAQRDEAVGNCAEMKERMELALDDCDVCDGRGIVEVPERNECARCDGSGQVSAYAMSERVREAEARADEWRTNTETAQAALDRVVRDLRDETARAERAERALRVYADEDSWDDVTRRSEDWPRFEWCGDDGEELPWTLARKALAAVSGEAPNERCEVCEGIDIPGATHNPNAPYCSRAGEAPNDEL